MKCTHTGFHNFYAAGCLFQISLFSFAFLFIKKIYLVLLFYSTFFKEFHEGLAHTVKSLLKRSETSEAIFFSPKRGTSLDKFLEKIKEFGLHFSVTENYDGEVWKLHQRFLNGDDSWPNYEKDHCYPLLVRITFWKFEVLEATLFFFSFLWSSYVQQFELRVMWNYWRTMVLTSVVGFSMGASILVLQGHASSRL